MTYAQDYIIPNSKRLEATYLFNKKELVKQMTVCLHDVALYLVVKKVCVGGVCQQEVYAPIRKYPQDRQLSKKNKVQDSMYTMQPFYEKGGGR